MTRNRLVALVERPRAESAADALDAEGVYDGDRSVAPYDERFVALPITSEPRETDVADVREYDLPRRDRGLPELLAERGFSEAEIERAPGSWAVIGSVVLVDFGSDVDGERFAEGGADDTVRRAEIGEALLELHGEADTVLARGGIDGETREPSPEVVAGSGETETIHVEHGVRYAVDLSKVMFSPGNKAERVRMGEVTDEGERVFDMFAGIGYFSLPMARAGADVTAAEINPEAYRFLAENAVLNGVSDRIRAVLGDCRDVETTADRVVMGYYDAYAYLDSAIGTLAPGGTVHLHEATPEPLFPQRPVERLEDAAADAGRSVEVLCDRVVKSHSEGVVHGVVDARLD